MFITTYSSANPNFKELISKHWSYLGRSSATRELGRQILWSRKEASLLGGHADQGKDYTT